MKIKPVKGKTFGAGNILFNFVENIDGKLIVERI